MKETGIPCIKGQLGVPYTPNSVPMVVIAFSRDSRDYNP